MKLPLPLAFELDPVATFWLMNVPSKLPLALALLPVAVLKLPLPLALA